MFEEVIVPFNGSDATTRALEIGAGLARSGEARLRILAYRRDPDSPVMSSELWERAFDVGRRYDLEPHLTPLEPKRFLSDALISEATARPGSVICLAASGSGRRALLTGSLSAEVLRYGPGVAVLCGPHCEETFLEHAGPMVVAVDGSGESEEILGVADDWAQAFGVSLEVVTVLPVEESPELAAAIASGDVQESSYVRGVVRHDAAVEEHGASFDVLHGKPAEAIVTEAMARDASMVAMASHVPLGLERLLHGSTTDLVVRNSPVPVLAIRIPPVDDTA